MNTFGDRVRGAMFAAGMSTPAQLGKACGASRQVVTTWLTMKEAHLSALHLYSLAQCLNVRMRWLVDGKGISSWSLYGKEPALERAALLLERLSAIKTRRWLEAGERMAGNGK